MAKEIERKYLVKDDCFASMATSRHIIRQGYLTKSSDAVVRLRIIDDEALITVKSKVKGISRGEWEYKIPKADAEEMMSLCSGNVIEKTRYIVPFEGFVWEVDVFAGRHSGLFIAEIELPSEDATFDLPPFVGDEVTGNPRYYNSNLSLI